MSYIEKERLIKADIISIENKVRHAFNQGYDLGFKDGKEKANSLEQETILDKLRAEITELDKKVCQQFLIEDVDKEVHHTYQECLKIIDKYKAER